MISIQLIRKFFKTAKLGKHRIPGYEDCCSAVVLNPPTIDITYRNYKVVATAKSLTVFKVETNKNLTALKLVTFNRYISKQVFQSKFSSDLSYAIGTMYDALESLLTGEEI